MGRTRRRSNSRVQQVRGKLLAEEEEGKVEAEAELQEQHSRK